MSVIQSIRERYAKWAVVAIALALLGFILTDYFSAKSRMVGGPTTIGVVNGKKIGARDFQARLEAAEAQAKAQADQMQQEYGDAQRHNTNESLWNRDVEKIVMTAEFEKAGIEVGGKELTEYFYKNPPPDLRQNFTDQMGNLDVAGLQNWMNQAKRSTNQADRDQLNRYLAEFEYQLRLDKYNGVLRSAVYYPKWYVEKQNADAALMAKISYISHPYASISDSAVTVTDKEIEDYVNAHKETFRQEESRSIAFVLFDAAATPEDSAQIRTQLTNLKEDFAKDTLVARFLSGKGSATSYQDEYLNKSEIRSAAADTIVTIPKGSVYGPYLDDHSYVVAKKVDEKRLADSVYCRHILIRTQGAGGVPDSIASKRIDSVISVVKDAASFVRVMKQVSMDSVANTQDSLGIMRFSIKDITNAQSFDQDFAKYILFDGTKGQRQKVKTQFGYHYIEIVDQKNIQPYYKFAFLSKNILATKETERRASEEASKFSNEARDLKSFEALIARSGGKYKKREATNIGPNDISIQSIDELYSPAIGGFGKVISCRSLIKQIYEADKGDVLKQEKIGNSTVGNKQVIAVVTDVLKEGIQPAYIARFPSAQSPSGVERILKDKKKAEQIKKMIGTVTTLEAAAAALKDSIVTIDSVRISGVRQLFDPKVLGAVFNNANKGKVVPEPIAGADAVYVVRVDDLATTSIPVDIERQKESLRNNGKQRQQFNTPIPIFKKKAKISDNRKNIY